MYDKIAETLGRVADEFKNLGEAVLEVADELENLPSAAAAANPSNVTALRPASTDLASLQILIDFARDALEASKNVEHLDRTNRQRNEVRRAIKAIKASLPTGSIRDRDAA